MALAGCYACCLSTIVPWKLVPLLLEVTLKTLLALFEFGEHDGQLGDQDFVGAAGEDDHRLQRFVHALAELFVDRLEFLSFKRHLFGDVAAGEDRF